MTEARGDEIGAKPFDQWLAAARPPVKTWRVALGICAGVAIWMACSTAVPWMYYYSWILLGDPASEDFYEEMSGLADGSTYLGTLVLLLSSAGFWIGAYLLTRLHGQPFWSLVSAQRRLSWNGFGTGVLLCLGITMAGMIWDSLDPLAGEPYANGTTFAHWLLSAGPVVALVFIQAGGEELFFRGYVMQRLAARYRNPIIWALLPSVAFGAIHFFNGVSLEHSIYYVIYAAILGVTSAAVVWRTGDLSAAIGLHVATNVIAFLVSGTDNFFTATPLWLWPVETSIAAMPSTIVLELLLLGFVLWGPFPGQPRARRNAIRAAP